MSGRCSETEALNLLRREFSATDSAKRLTQAVHDRTCRLWCDGKLVKPHIAVVLLVEPKLDDDERWTARIISAVREAWDQPAYEVVTEILEAGELFGEIVFKEVVKTVMTKPPYKFEFDVDEVVALLPVRRGPKGKYFEIHTTLELERLGRKAALDLHNSRQLVDHLEKVLKREVGHAPKDDKTLPKLIRDFLRGGGDFRRGRGLRRY